MSRTLILLLLLGLLLVAALLVVRPWDGSVDSSPRPVGRASTVEHEDAALTLKGAPATPTSASPAPVASAPQGPPSGYVLDRTAPPPFLRALPPAPPAPRMRVRGRLLEPDGMLATGALVGVRSVTGADANHFALGGKRRSDAEGRFEVSVQHATEIELWAWSQRSAPVVLPRHVSPADEVDLGDVVLPGGLTLTGRFLVGGRPSPYGPVEVRVMRAGVMGVMGSFEWGLVSDAAGRPLSASRTVESAEDGSWSVEGLSPGSYDVRLGTLGGADFHVALLKGARRSITAPASGIDFDLAVSLLAVAPPDGRGYPSKGQLEVTTPEGSRACISASGLVNLQAFESGLIDDATAGDELLIVPAATRLELWAQWDGLEGWRETVVSARAGERLRVTPTPREGRTGWIRLRRAEDARQLPSRLRMRVTVPGTGNLVVEETTLLAEPEGDGQLALPLGVWNVELRPADPSQCSDAELVLPQMERVEVGPTLDAAPILLWSPARGGRIRLQVEAADGAQPRITCTLLRGGQPALTPWFRSVIDLAGVERSSMHQFTSPLVAGVRMETDGALAPGGARLRLECDGFEPHEEPVVIRPGETTDVTVRLTPR